MSTSRKTKPQAADPSLRERAKVARASATRLSRGSGRTEERQDPILAAIERHGIAARTFEDAKNLEDLAWVAKHGRAISIESMTDAKAFYEAADLAQIEAWNALFDTQPTTSAGLVALLRHVGDHAESMLDTGGAYSAGSIFDVMADRVAALSGQLHGARPCQAGIVAARLGTTAAEWLEADAEAEPGRIRARAIEERLKILAEAISYMRASSPVGMLGQLVVAFDAVDTTLNGRDDLRGPAARRAERCLLSVGAALCALSGIDREGYGASYMMSGRLDWMACLSPEAA